MSMCSFLVLPFWCPGDTSCVCAGDVKTWNIHVSIKQLPNILLVATCSKGLLFFIVSNNL